MQTPITFLTAAACLVAAALAQQPSQPPKPSPEHQQLAGGSGERTSRELKVLELSGPGYARGLQHGQQLRSEIAKIVALWKNDLRAQSKLDPDSLIKTILAETGFTPAIKQWTPDLLEEVRGIAAGAGQPFETMFAFQLVDEIWVFLDKRAANRCSAMGVARSGSHPAYVAQNMDLESFRDGFQVVLHIAGHELTPEQFVFTQAGMIALNGVNRHSIGIVCNALMHLNASSNGLPVAFVLRGVLAQTNGIEALKFVRNLPHATGQNYIIGVGDRVYDLEASAGKVVAYRPVPDGGVVFHTNHRLVNDNLRPSLSADWEKDLVNSQTRFASLQTRLSKPAAAIDASVIKDALRSKDSELHPVCRPLKADAGGFTFGATIMTLSGTPSLEVTLGPPDVNPFVPLQFSTISAESAIERIRPEAIRAHLEFLADDLLEGRGTGSRGHKLAVNYLCAQCAAAGLHGGAESTSQRDPPASGAPPGSTRHCPFVRTRGAGEAAPALPGQRGRTERFGPGRLFINGWLDGSWLVSSFCDFRRTDQACAAIRQHGANGTEASSLGQAASVTPSALWRMTQKLSCLRLGDFKYCLSATLMESGSG